MEDTNPIVVEETPVPVDGTENTETNEPTPE